MSKNEALDLAIRSLQRNMDEILFLQGNNAITYPQLNMFNEAILQLHKLKNVYIPKDGEFNVEVDNANQS